MASKLRNEIELNVLAAEFEQARRRDSSGFDPTWFEELITALCVHAPLDAEASDRDRDWLCREVVSSVADQGQFTGAVLKAHLARHSKQFLAQPPKRYVLVTNLSCDFVPALTPKRIEGWQLHFTDGCPPRFDRRHVPSYVWARVGAAARFPTCVRVSGLARTQHEAVANGLNRLDCIRSIWNFVLNRRLLSISSSSEEQPINELRVGPIHTLHWADGTRASDAWWYDLFPHAALAPTRIRQSWPAVVEQTNAIRHVLMTTPLGKQLRPVLIRYCHALDGGDPEGAVLQLWSILETLTSTGSEGYDETIRRVQFLFGDDPKPRYTLKLLRERRNRFTHAGVGGINARKTTLQLNRFVTELLTVALRLSDRFASLKELGEFLALPRDAARLKSEVRIRQAALKFQSASGLRARRLSRG